MGIDRTGPLPTPEETRELVAKLRAIMQFDIAWLALARGTTTNRRRLPGTAATRGAIRRHIRVLAPFAGLGISRLPGDFLCLGKRAYEPVPDETPDILPDCSDCLRSVRRLFAARLTRRQRRAMY
jgi:hypothetical protein